ncbi:hypothetical protein B0J18DRAFT_481043 [Chaetomium sp. MPI-SDFR-AT-0129]|nr:hypothetical protein B0J18DRAFT_481043 [Chaetomium sp. MPI-SDFR-AT-0129]
MYKSVVELSIFIMKYLKNTPIVNYGRALLGRLRDSLSGFRSRITTQLSHIEDEEPLASFQAMKTGFEPIEKILKGPAADYAHVQTGYHIPFSRNPHFVGWEDVLKLIGDVLSVSVTPTAGSHDRTIVLHGLGGMGKTETALEFAHRVAAIPARPEKDVRARDQVLMWLKTTSTSWLVVFDNAPDLPQDAKFLRDFWPNGKAGSILVTTRNACLAREHSIRHEIGLGPIDEDASIKILTRQLADAPTIEAHNQAREICRQLGHFPLALSQISGYLHESGCDLSDFLATYRDFKNLGELHATSNPGSTTGYQHNLSTVWAMTMSVLERKSPTALKTLSILAFLDPDGFPQKVLEDTCSAIALPPSFSYMMKAFPLQQSLRPLQSCNLITIDRLNGLIKIHRVLQDSAMTRLDRGQKVEAFDMTVQILYELFPTQELAESQGFGKVCERGDMLYNHVISALLRFECLENATPSPKLYDLIQRFFWYLHHRGLYETALPYFDLAIKIYGIERAKNLRYLAFLHGTAGTIYRNSDNAKKAVTYFGVEISLYEEAIKTGRMEPNHERLAYAYEHMAVALQQLGDYNGAFIWHARNLHILENFHPEDRAGILLAYVNKSWAMWKSGALSETSVLLEWVLKEAQEILEKNSEEFLACRVLNFGMRALGNVRIDQGRWEDAFNLHRRAWEFQLQTWGETHFETGVSCYKMGCHYERMSQNQMALDYFRSALVIFTNNKVPTESLALRPGTSWATSL